MGARSPLIHCDSCALGSATGPDVMPRPHDTAHVRAALPRQAVRGRPRSAPQTSKTPAASTTGNTTSFTMLQPKLTSSAPEEKEPIAINPNTRKSLKACTLLRSLGRWHVVTIVVAPMKAKFHPTPSSAALRRGSRVRRCVLLDDRSE